MLYRGHDLLGHMLVNDHQTPHAINGIETAPPSAGRPSGTRNEHDRTSGGFSSIEAVPGPAGPAMETPSETACAALRRLARALGRVAVRDLHGELENRDTGDVRLALESLLPENETSESLSPRTNRDEQ